MIEARHRVVQVGDHGGARVDALHPHEVAPLLTRFGLTLREDLGADDYRRRTGLTDTTGYAFYRLAIADIPGGALQLCAQAGPAGSSSAAIATRSARAGRPALWRVISCRNTSGRSEKNTPKSSPSGTSENLWLAVRYGNSIGR